MDVLRYWPILRHLFYGISTLLKTLKNDFEIFCSRNLLRTIKNQNVNNNKEMLLFASSVGLGCRIN